MTGIVNQAKEQRKREQAERTAANKKKKKRASRRGATRRNKNKGAKVGKKLAFKGVKFGTTGGKGAGKSGNHLRRPSEELTARGVVWLRECPDAWKGYFRRWLDRFDAGDISHFEAQGLLRCADWRAVADMLTDRGKTQASQSPAALWLRRNARDFGPEAFTS